MSSFETPWDPDTIRTVVGIDKSHINCYGITEKNEECGRVIGQTLRAKVEQAIEGISRKDPLSVCQGSDLDNLAKLVHCARRDNKDHQGQAPQMAQQCRENIRAHVNNSRRRRQENKTSDGTEAEVSLPGAALASTGQHQGLPTSTARLWSAQPLGGQQYMTSQQAATSPCETGALGLQVHQRVHTTGRSTHQSAVDAPSQYFPGTQTSAEVSQQRENDALKEQLDRACRRIEMGEERMSRLEHMLEQLQIGVLSTMENPSGGSATPSNTSAGTPKDAQDTGSSTGGSISGDCVICKGDLIDRSALVPCHACEQYMHLSCMRGWWHTGRGRACPLW